MNTETSITPKKLLIGITIIVLIAVSVAAMKNRTKVMVIPPELMGVLWPGPRPLEDFNLIDQHKVPFTEERLQDKWSFLFIGYTHCPDICPMALSTINSTYNLLKPEVKADTQVVFVSVDPERDTAEHLANYMTYFNEEFVGVTGEQSEIDLFAKKLGAGYQKEAADESGNYQVAHTSSFFLVNPEGGVVGTFAMPHIPKTIADQYLQIRAL